MNRAQEVGGPVSYFLNLNLDKHTGGYRSGTPVTYFFRRKDLLDLFREGLGDHVHLSHHIVLYAFVDSIECFIDCHVRETLEYPIVFDGDGATTYRSQ